jgi:hypothetical protein
MTIFLFQTPIKKKLLEKWIKIYLWVLLKVFIGRSGLNNPKIKEWLLASKMH